MKARNKARILASSILASLFAAGAFWSGFEGNWRDPFAWAPFLLAGLIAWLIWIIHSFWIIIIRSQTPGVKARGALFLALVLGSVLAIGAASRAGTAVGKEIYFNQIKTAADAGLQQDCLKLMQDWPTNEYQIDTYSPDYKAMPASIKMLKPGYVLKEDSGYTNSPSCIGICTDGFGGFATGIRVFKDDHDAEKFIADWKITMKVGRDFGFQRVVPGVYYWWQDT